MRCVSLIAIAILIGGAAGPNQPDPSLTPGAVRTDVPPSAACTTKWGKDERAVTESMKRRVFRSYGFPLGNKDPRCPCEADHRVPRELLGADVAENLWIEQYFGPWNAHMKDRLENRVHREVCSGRMTLDEGQAVFLGDWQAGYVQFFGAGSRRKSSR